MPTFTETPNQTPKEETNYYNQLMSEVNRSVPEFTGLKITKIERVESSQGRAKTTILVLSAAALGLPMLLITAYAMYQGDRELMIQIVGRSQYGFVALLLTGLGYLLVRKKGKNEKNEDD